jgi:hypothetical protein
VIAGFEMPTFSLWKIVYTAIGASVYWGLWGRTKLRPYVLPDILEHLPFKNLHPLIEFLLFLTLGCIVGIGFTNPGNPQQAITAGMGWTGVFAKRKGR